MGTAQRALLLGCMLCLGSHLLAAQDDRDKKIEEAVRAGLKKADLDKEVAEVAVAKGVVTLKGKPKNAYLKMKVIETVLKIEGVEAVQSDLEVAEPESSQDFTKELVNRVLTYPHYTVFDDINFSLEEGNVVTVSGYVTMPIKKDEIEERVGQVKGVRELKSQIKVLPVSQSDDQLRDTLFANIYNHELFVRYASMTHPPIHIIVSGGNVILTGAVSSKIESRQAELIARSTFGVINVTNRLTVSR